MNYKKLIIAFAIGMFGNLYSQDHKTDQLFLAKGEVLAVTIKKVEPNTITYNFSGEDLENIVEKNDVSKIIFKNGREQLFSAAQNDAALNSDFEYPPMQESEGAILPFEFIFDGSPNPEFSWEAQEFYYKSLLRRPEKNTIAYQDAETTQIRLRNAGIKEATDLKDFDMSEIAKIVGAGILVTGKISVNYRSTISLTSGSSTTKLDTKKKKVRSYSSDYSTSNDEYDTKVAFKIYDLNGTKIIDETRRPFMAAGRNDYILTLNYLMKRTPYYQK